MKSLFVLLSSLCKSSVFFCVLMCCMLESQRGLAQSTEPQAATMGEEILLLHTSPQAPPAPLSPRTATTHPKPLRPTHHISRSQNKSAKTSPLLKPLKTHLGKKPHSPTRNKGNFMELDWLMVTITVAVGLLLMILLWLLIRPEMFTLLHTILVGLGFGIGIFTYFLADSESDTESAMFEYFIRWGILAFPGWSLIVAGFVGLFGGNPSIGIFFLVGLILGGISFLLSLFFKRSILHRR